MSTLITLVLVPLVYSLLGRRSRKAGRHDRNQEQERDHDGSAARPVPSEAVF